MIHIVTNIWSIELQSLVVQSYKALKHIATKLWSIKLKRFDYMPYVSNHRELYTYTQRVTKILYLDIQIFEAWNQKYLKHKDTCLWCAHTRMDKVWAFGAIKPANETNQEIGIAICKTTYELLKINILPARWNNDHMKFASRFCEQRPYFLFFSLTGFTATKAQA